jgi:hypothetical protein
MKKVQLAIIVAGIVIAFQARATLTVYDLTFTQTGESDTYGNAGTPSVTAASGWLDVENGLAVGGVLDVTSGPKTGVYTLVPGSGTDGSFVYDNIVYTTPVNGGFLDTTAGLLWSLSGTAGDNSSEMNMWYNAAYQPGYIGDPAGTYSLWGALPNYNPEAYGNATLTPAPIPEASTMLAGALMLLPFGVGAIRSLRRGRTA